ncbi:hypothetical protein [Microbacterium telephonicum]|uniref:Uncharacterized protein n=1 Tax=Microbacterium telephonicum TaxID=1714841 RepID=A0A498CA20_9MICO|nr:hypothetical protein [Microbacterium telephonicum]RLK52552.1 hypothetical protein C7474_0500 [Microbacterium telephonicum]
MSDSYESVGSRDVEGSASTSGKVDAAKHEAADVKDTAAAKAKNVLGTAKDEASSVVGEAKTQVKDLYAQSTREVKEQAGAQQQRLAAGLRSVGDELGAMAARSEGHGIAGDLVQQVSTRLTGAATWLGDRDPAAVLSEVKRFARRRPGTFILGAAIAGIVVGRLTRALASNASDDSNASDQPTQAGGRALPATPAREPVADAWEMSATGNAGVDAEAPLYAQTTAGRPDILPEDGDDRSDTV